MKKFVIKFLMLSAMILMLLSAVLFLLPDNPENLFLIWEKKINAVKNPKRDNAVIFLGGSNLAFGLNSAMLEDSLKMDVINTGIHAGIGMKTVMDEFSPYIKSGDIVVIAAEYNNAYGVNNGEDALSQLFFTYPYTAKNFNLLQWKAVLSNVPFSFKDKIFRFITSLIPNHKPSSDYHFSSFNEYGDVTSHWKKPCNNKQHLNAFDEKDFDSKYFVCLKRKITQLQQKGVTVIVVPPVIEEYSFNAIKQNVKHIEQEYKKNGINLECPSEEFVFSNDLAYNTHYHFGKQGTDKRTLLLIPIIRKYIDK